MPATKFEPIMCQTVLCAPLFNLIPLDGPAQRKAGEYEGYRLASLFPLEVVPCAQSLRKPSTRHSRTLLLCSGLHPSRASDCLNEL